MMLKERHKGMADKCDLCLPTLMIFFSLLQVPSGQETHVFCSSGETVSLPCNHILADCTSTIWIYSRHRDTAVELFIGGIKNSIQRTERFSVGSDCSLNINKTTAEDYGYYTCRQYAKNLKHGNDASVYLHVLQVSPSSTQTDIRPDSSVTLTCQLYSYEPCDNLFRFERLQLVWVNQADVNLQTDSRYQILSSPSRPGHCISTLTTRLLNKNRALRCLVTSLVTNEIKASASYTVKYLDPDKNPPVTTTNSETSTSTINTSTLSTSTINSSETEGSATCVSLYRVIIVIVVMAVFAAPTVILLQIICAGRAEIRRRTQTSWSN